MRTERTRKLPPFYTQVIGSLPRPKLVLDLISRQSEISKERFRTLMEEMVTFAIRLQEQAGLDVVSDGEWRRVHYVVEFLQRVGGFEKTWQFERAGEKRIQLVVTGRMQAREPVFVRDAEFLVKHTDRITKFALPSPFLIGIRYWNPRYSAQAYPTVEHFMEHLTAILAVEAKALVEAGIDIIQLDDPALTYFCDRNLMERGETHDERLRRPWNPDHQIAHAITCINTILADLEAETHLHCCHSVYRRGSDITGNYEPLLPRLKHAKIDRLNLEFAFKDVGVPSDLNLLPEGLGLGMGVVDVRRARLPEVEEIESLAAAGAEIVGADRMALNPDCGFAPDSGELPTIDEAFEKLSRLTAAAQRLRARFRNEEGSQPASRFVP